MLVSLCALLLSAASSTTVETNVGKFVGTSFNTSGFSFDSFQGIQFALVGKRFSRSTVVERAPNNLIDATRPGPWCYQSVQPIRSQFLSILNFFPQDEECLYLNIYRPSNVTSNLTVMVWIYGGGFLTGSASIYDVTNFVREHNVIVVTFNYRMGLFGFLEADGGGGLNGIHDQILALQWVHNHIHSFGGNPYSVTVFGQSAGSLSACMLAVSPLAEGLFQRVILMSGSCASFIGPQDMDGEEVIEFREQLLQATGVLSVSELINTTRYPPSSITGYSSSLDRIIQPTVDGYVLPMHPRELYSRSENIHVRDFMMGSTSYDDYFSSTLNVSYVLENVVNLKSQRDWVRQVQAATFKDETWDEVSVNQALDAYAPIHYDGNPVLGALQLFGDSLFRCWMRELAATVAHQIPGNVFLYNYAYLSSADLLWATGLIYAANLTQDRGFASHGSEGSVVFGTFVGVAGPVTPSKQDITIGQEMRMRWTAFAKYGDPNTAPRYLGWNAVSKDGTKKNGRLATEIPVFIFGPSGGVMTPVGSKAKQCSNFIGKATVQNATKTNLAGKKGGRKERKGKKQNGKNSQPFKALLRRAHDIY